MHSFPIKSLPSNLLLLLAFPFFGQKLAAQSTEDPFALDPSQRNKASLPVPYGIIVGGMLPVIKATSQDVESGLLANVDAYYDTWGLGFHKADYGNVITIMNRTATRDVYFGWFAELGWIKRPITFSNTSGVQTTANESGSILGFGYKGGFGYDSTIAATFNYGIAGGALTFEHGSSGFATVSISTGIRIPISTTALHLGVTAYASLIPNINDASDGGAAAGLGLNASYAFNFSKE